MPPSPDSARPAAATAAVPAAPPSPVIQLTRAVAVAALLGLVALGLAWELWLAPTGQKTLALKVLPLLLPVVGLLKNRLYTYRWVSLVIWLYFIEGVVRGNGLEGGVVRWLGWGEVALCTLLFTACTVHIRWRLKHPTSAGEPPVPNMAG